MALVDFPGWEQFNDRLLCGAPSAAPRLEPVPVRIPLPKHARSGSIYEVQSALAESAFG